MEVWCLTLLWMASMWAYYCWQQKGGRWRGEWLVQDLYWEGDTASEAGMEGARGR